MYNIRHSKIRSNYVIRSLVSGLFSPPFLSVDYPLFPVKDNIRYFPITKSKNRGKIDYETRRKPWVLSCIRPVRIQMSNVRLARKQTAFRSYVV